MSKQTRNTNSSKSKSPKKRPPLRQGSGSNKKSKVSNSIQDGSDSAVVRLESNQTTPNKSQSTEEVPTVMFSRDVNKERTDSLPDHVDRNSSIPEEISFYHLAGVPDPCRRSSRRSSKSFPSTEEVSAKELAEIGGKIDENVDVGGYPVTHIRSHASVNVNSDNSNFWKKATLLPIILMRSFFLLNKKLTPKMTFLLACPTLTLV